MKRSIICMLVCLPMLWTACEDNEYQVPDGVDTLTDDCLKRSVGPNLVGQTIDFSYAMALPLHSGRLVSARVEASIPGAAGTTIESSSYHTDASGKDVGVVVAGLAETQGGVTDIAFAVDTCAATLRYHYVVPEEARGKTVRFVFSATDDQGRRVSRKMGDYAISEMDMKLDLVLKNNTYLSISDMEVYDRETAALHPEKVDLVYLFRTIRGVQFKHAFVSPTEANSAYLPNVTLPDGVGNSTKLLKVFSSCDQQLARTEYGVFVTDNDLRTMDFSQAPDYAINLIKQGGAWLETADGKYRAYMYINEAADAKAGVTVSIKRLRMK